MSQDRPGTFDQFLRKSNLKNPVKVQDFCKSRIDEILMLTEALKESPFRGQAFQRLPKHMRRRQMSHHIKRLPRRLRTSTLLSVQMDASGLPKRPSRKYRRRPVNLLNEYNRRQRKSIWLETHIWHARRFHMTSKWGYSIPEKPTNKSFRACYRAVAKHCSITDLSYYGVIELQGQEGVLLEGLQQCTSKNCGLTFAAKMFKSGSREGFVTMYHPNSYPYAVIGEVSFLWKPIETENKNRTIWIFIHPSIYNEITDVLKTLFSLCTNENSDEVGISDVKSTPDTDYIEKNETVQKSKASNLLEEIAVFVNKDGSVIMTELKNKMNRFSLKGPLSMAVISNAFDVFNLPSIEENPHVESAPKSDNTNTNTNTNPNSLKRVHSEISDNESEENNKRMKMDATYDAKKNDFNNRWWSRFYNNEFRKKCLENQANFYTKLTSFQTPSDLPPGMVISVVVKDPRLTLPSKRMKCVPNNKGAACVTSIDSSLCYSALWEADLMEQVSNDKTPTAAINKARSRLVVPGSDVKKLIKDSEQNKVPLIIIQRTSLGGTNRSDRHDFGSGFDIIVPVGWAMPVWLSLIFRGARPAGLRETMSMTLESKNLGEYIQLDSSAGEYENLERHNKLKTIYFKRPPSKRPNFAKIGIECPFYFPWKALVNDWSHEDSQLKSELKFYVLRDLEKLSRLSDFFESAMSKKSKLRMESIDAFRLDDMNCLVPIIVQSCGKGAPTENAMLCLPTSGDVTAFKNKNICPVENSHTDPNVKTRKVLKLEHRKLLKSMKRKRKLYKMKESERQDLKCSEEKESDKVTYVNQERIISASQGILGEYVKNMEELWLKEPLKIQTVRNSCSRQILGYVVLGGFSFSEANGMGLGYVTLQGVLHLLKTSFKEGIQPLILYRNNNCVKYRFVRVQICMNKRY